MQFQEFVPFMQDYADFFDLMLEEEKAKLDALLSYDLEKVEHSIGTQQAFEKQMGNFERKREELQEKLGIEGKTFREIAEIAQGEEKKTLQTLFARVEQSVNDVKYHNEKSMEFVRMNLKTVQSMPGNSEDSARSRVQAYSANITKKPAGWGTQSTMFEKKI